MASPLSPGRIRDPVHGYISFTAIERALLDHPVAQRLRNIGQSAAAQLVFPDMLVTRMAHSLGAMHLASRFLEASLANASEEDRAILIEGFRATVQRHANLGLGADPSQALSQQRLLTGRGHEGEDRVAVLLVEQGLRLASLVHDLGHLPFSHDFEEALEDYWRHDAEAQARAEPLTRQGPGGDKVHERIGYALANVVQHQVFNERLAGHALAKPAEVALLIARDILNAPAAPELDSDAEASVLSWLHSLVAGEIDVDRADYVLRDGLHYGLAAAGYDLDRLVDNLVPLRRDDGRFDTAVLPQGVSAAEAFLVARFRMYTWAVYHHKIQQAAAGLRVGVAAVLRAGGEEIGRFLADLVAIAEISPNESPEPEVLQRFVDYDDAWWRGLMRDHLRRGADATVEPWLRLFLYRTPGPISLWKRPAEFPVEDRYAWNRRLPDPKQDFELAASWETIRSALREQGVLLERVPFRPWNAALADEDESVLQVRTEAGPVPLTRLSPLTWALSQAWAEELHVLAFADEQAQLSAQDVIDRLSPALKPPKPQEPR